MFSSLCWIWKNKWWFDCYALNIIGRRWIAANVLFYLYGTVLWKVFCGHFPRQVFSFGGSSFQLNRFWVMRVPACSHIRLGGVCSASPHNQPQLAWHRTCTMTSSYTNSQNRIQWGFRAHKEEGHVLSCHTNWYQRRDRDECNTCFLYVVARSCGRCFGSLTLTMWTAEGMGRSKNKTDTGKKQLYALVAQ